MAQNIGYKGRGHKDDDVDERDRKIDMSALHLEKNNDNASAKAFNLFENQFYNKTLDKFMPLSKHLYDQGDIGTCTCNAVASAYRYALKRQAKADFKPSRLFLYYVVRIDDSTITAAGFGQNQQGKYYHSLANNPPPDDKFIYDGGSTIRDNIRILANLGAPAESEKYINWDRDTWPYVHVTDTTNEWEALPEPEKSYAEPSYQQTGSTTEIFPTTALPAMRPAVEAFKAAERHAAVYYGRPAEKDIGCWRTCIANGYPIIFGMQEYKDFKISSTNQPYCATTPDSSTEFDTAHTVLAVGWDNDKYDMNGDKGCLLVQNSWGSKTTYSDPTWDGFFWLPYSWLTMPSPKDPTKMMVSCPWVLVDTEDYLVAP